MTILFFAGNSCGRTSTAWRWRPGPTCARSTGTSANGLAIECSVKDIVIQPFGEWTNFAAYYTCSGANAVSYQCQRDGVSSTFNCSGTGSYPFICQGRSVVFRSTPRNVAITTPPGTKNAQNKACGDLFPSVKVSVD